MEDAALVLEGDHGYGVLMSSQTISPRRRGETGLTLIEMIVALAIVAIMAGALGAIFSVGLITLKPNGTTDRLAGANDFSVLEQQLGRDGGRAACIQVPAGNKYGSCSVDHGYDYFVTAKGCTNALCLAWPQLSDGSCQVAKYNFGTNVTVIRALFAVSASGVVSSPLSVQLTSDHVDAVVASGSPAITMDPNGNNWVRELDVNLTAEGTGTAAFFNKTIGLHPISTDPDGATAVVGANGMSPC